MPIDVLMPQMGESVTEGTVTKWLKKEGEVVGRDEPLFEISTDKVDAEIPSPAAGVLAKILVSEGQTVGVHTVVGQIDSQERLAGNTKAASKETAAVTTKEPAKEAAKRPGEHGLLATGAAAGKPGPVEFPSKPKVADQLPKEGREREAEEEQIRTSPLVRRLAAEHNVDLSQVEGTGLGGRVTKEDLLAYVERRGAQQEPAATPPRMKATGERERVPKEKPAPIAKFPAREEIVPMSPMRKRIAEHMVLSRRTSAHVTTVFAVDFTRALDLFHREKERFEREAETRLGYTPFFVRAVIDGLKRFPVLNSSVAGDNIVYKKDIHMGIAVALEWGLIVPVIHHAKEKSFAELARAINDLADRARRKKLSVDEVQDGTFTVTNPGALGALFATPIINQPQVGIVGVGGVNKMPVVINDAIAIRSIVLLSLSYDHRVIDGYVADQFMGSVKNFLENWEEKLL